MSHKGHGYSSDLTDEQWAIIEPLLPLKHWGPGRPITLDIRAVVEAILYLLRTGCQWRNLPHEYPNYNSVYYHYRHWCAAETWENVNTALREQVRSADEREVQSSAAIIDSQTVKTTEAGGERGYDAGKQIKGRKRHILVDTLGNLLTVVVHAANLQDREGAKLVLNHLPDEAWERLERIWADSNYSGDLEFWVEDTFDGVILDIVHKLPDQAGFVVLPKRWIVERTFAWLGRYRRLSKDYERLVENSAGMVFLASIDRMLTRLAPAA